MKNQKTETYIISLIDICFLLLSSSWNETVDKTTAILLK